MKYREISVFKTTETRTVQKEKTKVQVVQTEKRREPVRKRWEPVTKEVVVRAPEFLDRVAAGKNVKYPLILSLRYPNGGVNWRVENRRELLRFAGFSDMARSNVVYVRAFKKGFYIECARYQNLEISKKWLPEVSHRSILSGEETDKLWKLFEKESCKAGFSGCK